MLATKIALCSFTTCFQSSLTTSPSSEKRSAELARRSRKTLAAISISHWLSSARMLLGPVPMPSLPSWIEFQLLSIMAP